MNRSNLTGHAFISSSSIDEVSHESDLIQGSFFTYHFNAGLRGAADSDSNNLITLGEAYKYAFEETLSATQTIQGGPQHANYEIQMHGKGELVLTDLSKNQATLHFDEKLTGYITIRDSLGRLIIELSKKQGKEVNLALEPNQYELNLTKENEHFLAKIDLKNKNYEILSQDLFQLNPQKQSQKIQMVNKNYDPYYSLSTWISMATIFTAHRPITSTSYYDSSSNLYSQTEYTNLNPEDQVWGSTFGISYGYQFLPFFELGLDLTFFTEFPDFRNSAYYPNNQPERPPFYYGTFSFYSKLFFLENLFLQTGSGLAYGGRKNSSTLGILLRGGLGYQFLFGNKAALETGFNFKTEILNRDHRWSAEVFASYKYFFGKQDYTPRSNYLKTLNLEVLTSLGLSGFFNQGKDINYIKPVWPSKENSEYTVNESLGLSLDLSQSIDLWVGRELQFGLGYQFRNFGYFFYNTYLENPGEKLLDLYQKLNGHIFSMQFRQHLLNWFYLGAGLGFTIPISELNFSGKSDCSYENCYTKSVNRFCINEICDSVKDLNNQMVITGLFGIRMINTKYLVADIGAKLHLFTDFNHQTLFSYDLAISLGGRF